MVDTADLKHITTVSNIISYDR